ncbi:YesL family protein [Sporosarcina sp. FSL K6-3457]|uniref:YesL family protein n=1 Tax=Sporosarcina sp. FSL K6-3457 TaxID=2978204 RepID=UPI0030F6EF89
MKSIIDRPIYIIMKYVYYFLVTNFYFVLCNSLFFLVFYLADFTFENILLFFIASIPMGPSITALFSTMGKLVREKEMNPTSEYFKAYKANFFITMKYWMIQLSIIFILLIDVHYSTSNDNILSPFFLILLLICLFIMLYAFPIISRFEVKIKSLFIISIYSNFKFLKASLVNITSLIAFAIISINFPSISSLFSISLLVYFIMYNLREPLERLKVELSENGANVA